LDGPGLWRGRAREQRTNRGSVTVRALDTNRRMVPIDGWDGSSRSDIPVEKV